MPTGIQQPGNFKRISDTAVVRFKSHGKRFEIACYKNKVVDWREGIEKDLEKVLRSETIFINLSKGVVANDKDLQKVFGTVDAKAICLRILKEGELQISDKERDVRQEALTKDIIQIVRDQCYVPQTGARPNFELVDTSLKQLAFTVDPEASAKKQALDAIGALCRSIPKSFARVKIRLRVACPRRDKKSVEGRISGMPDATIEAAEVVEKDRYVVTFTCSPSIYKELETEYLDLSGFTLQVITMHVISEKRTTDEALDAAADSSIEEEAPPVEQRPTLGDGLGNLLAMPKTTGHSQCNTCTAEFQDVAEYRVHCRSEWHIFNKKRIMKELQPLREQDFAIWHACNCERTAKGKGPILPEEAFANMSLASFDMDKGTAHLKVKTKKKSGSQQLAFASAGSRDLPGLRADLFIPGLLALVICLRAAPGLRRCRSLQNPGQGLHEPFVHL